MANILKATYQGDNFRPNSKTYEITITLDDEIDSTTINNILCNNGNKYKTISGITFISTGSSAKIYTPTKIIIASFVAEMGEVNSITTYKEGVWKILGSITYQ